jgi:hypothetical protein
MGSPFFRPPGFSQDVAHRTEIVAGLGAGRPGVEEAAYLLEAVRQNIHDDHDIGKVKCGVSGIERLKQACSYIEFASQGLAALDGAIFFPAHIVRRAARQTAVLFMIIVGRPEGKFFRHRLTIKECFTVDAQRSLSCIPHHTSIISMFIYHLRPSMVKFYQ